MREPDRAVGNSTRKDVEEPFEAQGTMCVQTQGRRATLRMRGW
jgi:hypothetical protein